MWQGDIGMKIGATAADECVVPLYVAVGGAGTNVKVIAGDSVNYTGSLNGTTTAITVGNNVSFTTPTWLIAPGRSNVQITGPGY